MWRSFVQLSLTALLVSGCGQSGSGPVVVQGTGDEEFLNLRAGPGLGYSVVLGLPEGTTLNRRDCITELGQLWCEVSLTNAPRLSGYVAADYLSAP
ncbi:SH3 domain-containing protein [Flavimaricola marinus]|uniref:Bacterial SH3 domain protein n=1 Tax=Flavimaricola marinus TaxID=1819565 RepID=A0A238LEA9_9RHOB|nr:SH3 domain-containing protein [Flavimaricola marinus]SMY07296.1 Bacterial SH3 domain protein [Flavimaricola marinus]